MKVVPPQIGQFARGSVHVLLGGMLAAAFALLVFSFVTSIVNARGAGTDESIVGLGVLAALLSTVVVAIALSPPVRPLEAARRDPGRHRRRRSPGQDRPEGNPGIGTRHRRGGGM